MNTQSNKTQSRRRKSPPASEFPRALSVRQPWAWLIVNGYKDVENRNWPTKLRGVIYIHAGILGDIHAHERIRGHFPGIPLPPMDELERGGIVGHVEIYGSLKPDSDNDSPWYTGEHGFLLRNAKPLPFRPLRGQLGFFYIDAPARIPT